MKQKEIAVKITNLGKMYSLGDKEKYLTIRDAFIKWSKAPYRFITGKKVEKKEFWALRNVNLEVEQGDVIGIIGRNGSGKSTLLKILSRITEPTLGSITLKGRVSSLLEVGTGFHPELTGRDNVYLNGAILGMSRKEIESKFEQIIDFSGVREFIDVPVKRYSSGMQVRLAFSVAAHLDSDIMMIDEVLAVGDAEFQKKCLGKMEDVTKNKGRTVFFVSHDMSAIKRICNKCVVLKEGEVQFIGSTEKAIEEYFKQYSTSLPHIELNTPFKRGLSINALSLVNKKGEIVPRFSTDDDFYVAVKYTLEKELKSGLVGIELYNNEGTCILCSTDRDKDLTVENTKKEGIYTKYIPINRDRILRPGFYYVKVNAAIPKLEMLANPEESVSFEVVAGEKYPSYALSHGRRGVIEPTFKWEDGLV